MLILLFCSPVVLHAAEEPSTFTLHVASGKPLTGPLEKLAADWSIQLGGTTASRTEGGDVIALRRLDIPLPALPSGEQLILANGDRIPGTLAALAGESIRFQAGEGAEREWTLPLSALAVIWLAAPERADSPELLRRRLATGKRTRDIVHLRNGDVLEGILTALERGKKLQIEVDRKEVAVDFSKVAVVALNSELAVSTRPKGIYAHAVLTNGGRLSLVSARADAHLLTGTTATGMAVRLPLRQLVALELRQGRASYLSDLKPRRYTFTPFLDVRWPYVLDGNVQGLSLLLGGNTHDKGIGMRGDSQLVFDLAEGYRHFEALVGLDDRAAVRGSARVGVLVDGKRCELGWNGELVPRGSPRPIRVDVAGARELTLVVEFASRPGMIPGEVDWVDARLLK